MSDILFQDVSVENRINSTRPSLIQMKAIIAYMEKHPDLSKKKNKLSASKLKKLWSEFTNTINSLEGCVKSTKGWIKFWSDKRRFMISKQRQIDEGKLQSVLSPLELRILDLCEKKSNTTRKKKKIVKQEPYNGNDDLAFGVDDVFVKGEDLNGIDDHTLSTPVMDKQLNMIEKMVEAMDQQASSMLQMAQASLTNSKALERIAEASHVQALAVDRLVGTFETIGTSAHDIRNAILGIDYTLKRVYPANTQRQNLFS